MTEVSPAPAPAVARSKYTSIAELIVKAVAASKERSGMSSAAVKKALAAIGYDVEKNNTRVKTAIKSLVTKGTLVQTKGTGASGSYKISKTVVQKPAKKAAPKAKKSAVKKPAAAKKTKKKKKVFKPKWTGVTKLIVKAVAASKERSGVSSAAVKKALIAGGYDVEKNNTRVKTTIKSLVAKGTLVQTKGTGACGSYRMSKKPAKKPARTVKKPSAKKPAASKKTKTIAANTPCVCCSEWVGLVVAL